VAVNPAPNTAPSYPTALNTAPSYPTKLNTAPSDPTELNTAPSYPTADEEALHQSRSVGHHSDLPNLSNPAVAASLPPGREATQGFVSALPRGYRPRTVPPPPTTTPPTTPPAGAHLGAHLGDLGAHLGASSHRWDRCAQYGASAASGDSATSVGMRVHPAVGSTDRPDASERRPERHSTDRPDASERRPERQLSSACPDPTVPPPNRQRSTSWAQLGHSLRSLGQAAAPSLMRAPSRQSIKAGSMQALDKALDEIGIGEDFAVGAMLGTKGIDDAFDESDGSSNFLFASFLV
jgi:hypothetical protein